MRFLKRSAGFTLIEVLLVVMLASVAFGAISFGLVGGLRVYGRVEQLLFDQELALFFEKVDSDLKNACPYQKIPFSRTETSLSFATLRQEEKDPAFASSRPIQVNYEWNSQEGTVSRIESDPAYSVFEKHQILLQNVKSLAFDYSEYGKGAEIQVKVSLQDAGREKEFIKIFFMPSRYAVTGL